MLINHIEVWLFWITVFAYVAAFVAHVFAIARRKNNGAARSVKLMTVGLVFHTATLVTRWVAGKHAPVTDTYELNLTGTWIALILFLLANRLRRLDRGIVILVAPLSFIILGHGFLSRTSALPMGQAYDSPWLFIHVIFAWLAFGCFLVGAGAALLLLLKRRYPRSKRIPSSRSPADLDLMSYRFIVLGFMNHAVMLLSGAFWAQNLWGRYWSWDPLETWSLLTFLFYAFYLHARRFLGWKMERAAWLAAFGLLVLSISFWGVEWFAPSLHPGP